MPKRRKAQRCEDVWPHPLARQALESQAALERGTAALAAAQEAVRAANGAGGSAQG